MATNVADAQIAAAQQALAEQIAQNSTAYRISSHVVANNKIGSYQASSYIKFNVVFIEEPVFTTGGMVMKLSTQTGVTGGGSGTITDDYGDDDIVANVHVNRDEAFPYPIISAGVTRWVLDSKGQYVGAYYYLLVQYPMTIGVEAMGAPEPPSEASRLGYGAAQRQPRAATWEADGAVSLPVVTESLVQHWLKFEGKADWDFGATASAAMDTSLATRTPGIGDATGSGKFTVSQAQLDLAAAVNVVNVLTQNGAAGTDEYYAAVRDVRNAEAAVTNAQGGE